MSYPVIPGATIEYDGLHRFSNKRNLERMVLVFPVFAPTIYKDCMSLDLFQGGQISSTIVMNWAVFKLVNSVG